MHFTYAPEARSDLNQGDLVARNPEVEALLQEVHPHYFRNTSYKFFIILTQSCDLARRDGKPCKARYISIGAVRPLTLVIERELAKYQHTEIEKKLKFCSKDAYNRMVQFMERLLNNNEDEYFFLYRELSAGVMEDHCAFLHLSISVKADLHYQTLLSARILQLNDSFQHKLGYLVGNLYSRIGTMDWVPDNCSANEFDELRRTPLEHQDTVLWLEKSVYKAVVAKLQGMQSPSVENLQQVIQDTKVTHENKKQQVLKVISDVLTDSSMDSSALERILRRLENRPDFHTVFK